MKRTEDGTIKEKEQPQIFSTQNNNNYLSRSVEFLNVYYDSCKILSHLFSRRSYATNIQINLMEVNDGKFDVYVRVESTVAGFNKQIYNIILYKNSNLFSSGVHIQMYNQDTKRVLFTPAKLNGEPIIDINDWVENENASIFIQLWKQESEEEVKKSIEFTDCVIFTADGKQKFYANINVLVVSSKIIYNMIQDLQQQQYNHDNPLDLTELFRGFEYYEIHMYLCFVYNPCCTAVELQQILSLLKISIKLDNQGLIQRILAMDNLGCIMRDQIVLHDEENPCYVQKVLNFAKQHDFHKLMVFCCLELLSDQRRPGEMEPIISAYENNY